VMRCFPPRRGTLHGALQLYANWASSDQRVIGSSAGRDRLRPSRLTPGEPPRATQWLRCRRARHASPRGLRAHRRPRRPARAHAPEVCTSSSRPAQRSRRRGSSGDPSLSGERAFAGRSAALGERGRPPDRGWRRSAASRTERVGSLGLAGLLSSTYTRSSPASPG
jgi:hypothetical protein